MEEAIHMVPVPQSRLTEVYALLGAAPAPVVDPEASYEVPNEGGSWTIDELYRLYKKCNPTLVAVVSDVATRCLRKGGKGPYFGKSTQDTMIERAKPFYRSTTRDEEFTRVKLRAQLSWLSKHSRAVKLAQAWPLYIELAEGTVALYRMPKPLAEAWISFANRDALVDTDKLDRDEHYDPETESATAGLERILGVSPPRPAIS